MFGSPDEFRASPFHFPGLRKPNARNNIFENSFADEQRRNKNARPVAALPKLHHTRSCFQGFRTSAKPCFPATPCMLINWAEGSRSTWCHVQQNQRGTRNPISRKYGYPTAVPCKRPASKDQAFDEELCCAFCGVEQKKKSLLLLSCAQNRLDVT